MRDTKKRKNKLKLYIHKKKGSALIKICNQSVFDLEKHAPICLLSIVIYIKDYN